MKRLLVLALTLAALAAGTAMAYNPYAPNQFDAMSFAEEVKNEAAHLQPENDDCARAELAALLCMGCTVVAGPDGTAGMTMPCSELTSV